MPLKKTPKKQKVSSGYMGRIKKLERAGEGQYPGGRKFLTPRKSKK